MSKQDGACRVRNQKHFGQTQSRPAANRKGRRAPRGPSRGLLALVVGAIAAAGAPATSYAIHDSESIASWARTISATDEAHLHYVRHKSSESVLFEEGTTRGTLPGGVHAECHLGASFTANVTINTQSGTIHGHATATPHASGIYESFAGTLVVTGGTGRYSHAHGRAGLYGLFDRRTYALTVQTTGALSY